MATFTELLQSATSTGGRWRFPLPDDWLQGRSAYGGLQVAYAVHAMRALVPGAPLRTIQATFIAPVPLGQVEVEAQVLRAGKSTTHVEARILGPELQLSVVAVFGTARRSAVELVAPNPRPLTEPGVEFPFVPGLTPNFTQHFRVRLREGALPFTGVADPRQVLDVELRHPPAPSELLLPMYADFIPPIAISYLNSPSPSSTLTWMLELLRDRWDDVGPGPWRVEGRLEAALDGYTSQSITLWTPEGRPAAFSRQSMTIFG